MQHVYVLADYDEYGLEESVATLDRTFLPALLKRFQDGYAESYKIEATKRLAVLCQPDGEILTGRYNLMEGWGGVQLYVIKLES